MHAQIARGGRPDQPLIGRDQELMAIEAALASERLVTLTGLGGVGKSSLASALARRAGDRRTAVFVVDLAPTVDSAAVAAAIAGIVGARESPSADLIAAIAATLDATPSLLILDNFEQVLPARGLVVKLLDSAPGAKILVTSRAALGIGGEHQILVQALAVPGTADEVDAAPASRLFLRSSGAAGSTDLALDDVVAVVGICRWLDGLPLAIELAASWASILSPRAILRRLQEHALPVDATRDDRQASLERIIQATLELVEPEDRAAFDRLGAFVGTFDEAAARAVLDRPDALARLRALAAVALVRVAVRDDGEPSFQLLETVRAFARGRLDDAGRGIAAETRRRHAEHYAGRSELAADRLRVRTFGDPDAAAELGDPNVIAAFEFAVAQGDAELAARCAASMASGAVRSGIASAGIVRIERALELGSMSEGVRFDVLNALVNLRAMRGAGDQVELATRAVAAARASGDLRRVARGLTTLGMQLGDAGAATLREAIELAHGIDYHWLAATAAMNLGARQASGGHLAEAIASFEAARADYVRAADRVGMAVALANLGDVNLATGRPDQAIAAFEGALPVLRELAPAQFRTIPLAGLAIVVAMTGDTAGAQAHLAEASGLLRDTESRDAWTDVALAAAIVLEPDHPAAAARALGAVDAANDLPAYADLLRGVAGRLAQKLGQARFQRERRAGAQRDMRALGVEIGAIVAAADPARTIHLRAAFETLTPREAEVLVLLAEGRADPEIASVLGMTPRTASVHVSNIKGKLGASNRVESALMARRLLDDAARRAPIVEG